MQKYYRIVKGKGTEKGKEKKGGGKRKLREKKSQKIQIFQPTRDCTISKHKIQCLKHLSN